MSRDDEGDNLHADIVKGTAWVTALRLGVRGLGFISTLILARLLMPEDFGLVALASLIAASIELFGAFNFDIWLVRHSQPKRDDYDTVWTLALIRDLLIALMVIALAVPAAAWFGDPDLEQVLQVLAAATVVKAFRNIGVVDFRRDMQFDREFRFLGLSKLCSFVVTVALAFTLRNYWALLGGIVAGALSRLLLSYMLHPYRPRPSLCLARKVLKFSRWLLLLGITGFVYRRIQGLVIGKSMGSEALGFFSMAEEISEFATSELLIPLRRVLVPAYSRIQQDMPRLRMSFTDTFSLIILLGVPLTAGIALLAEPLVQVLLGDRWLPVVPIMRILAAHAMAAVFLANQAPVLMALGMTRLLSNLYGFALLLKIPLLLWAAGSGSLETVAVVIAAVHITLFAVSIVFTLRALELPLGDFLACCWHAPASTGLMATAVYSMQSGFAGTDTATWLALLVCVASGALVYCAAILVLWSLDRRHAGGQNIVIRFILDRRNSATTGTVL